MLPVADLKVSILYRSLLLAYHESIVTESVEPVIRRRKLLPNLSNIMSCES